MKRINPSRPIVASSAILLSGLFLLGNCSEIHSDPIKIQTGCGEFKTLSVKEINLLTTHNHQTSGDHDHPACPGFLAVIPEAQFSRSAQIGCQETAAVAAAESVFDYSLPEADSPLDDKIKTIMAKIESSHIAATVEHLSKNFPTRFHKSQHGLAAAQWIHDQMATIAEGREGVSVKLVSHNNTPQPSVMAQIKGVGPLSAEEVILGGHEDSVNGFQSRFFPDAPAPGADDNASGIGTLLEVFRVLVESGLQPERTITFYAYAAEEIGLVGSQEIAIDYTRQNKKVVGVLQIDMDGFKGANADLKIGFMDDFTNPSLTSHSKQLVERYLGLTVLSGTCGYGCSDHASWHKEGVPTIMPFEAKFRESVKKIHKPSDTADRLDFDYAGKFAQFAVSFAISLAHD